MYDNLKPTATVTTATIKGGNNITTAQSTEVGTLYLFTSGAVTITGAVTSVAVTAPNTNTNIPTTGVASGTYKVIAVDPSGNASAPSTNEITIDAITPTAIIVTTSGLNMISTTVGAISIGAINVQSTEIGMAYLVPDGDTTTANAVTFVAITTAIQNTAMNITAEIEDGDYRLLTVDLAGNISNPSEQLIIVDDTAPTVASATFTNATTLVIVFNEEVKAVTGDFTDGKHNGAGAQTFTVDSISGSGTHTIILTVTGSDAIATGNTGTIDIAATVTDLAGNQIVAAQAIVSGF